MILVTGGTGLIGSHLLYKLATQDKNIRALKRYQSNVENVRKVFNYYSENAEKLFEKIQWVDGDIRDKCSLYEVFQGVSVVYHIAGYVSFDHRKKMDLEAVNVTGTANMINMALEKNIRKFCYVSSIASFGDSAGDTLIDENTKWIPAKKNSFYSRSKFRAEMEVWRGHAEGLNTIIVNPSVVLGSGFKNSMTETIIKKIKNGFNYYTPGSTGYIDVQDVADIMIKLMNSEINGEQFILSAENLSYKEILMMFSQELGIQKQPKSSSKNLMKFLSFLEKIRSVITLSQPIITRESIYIAFKENRYSDKKIRDSIDHRYIPIKNTIRSLVENFKATH